MGKARAKLDGKTKEEVLNIQLHGDAAFSAQGVVYESFALGKVPKF
jgi:2-oxoglutarate dehydrogenase complex dehydrogenase (E1) component-like enzyme